MNSRPATMAEPLDRAGKQRLVDAVPHWHHSIDLGDGVVTPGMKTPHHFYDEMRRLHLPDLANTSVIDIGAWDGFYTFHAEHLGARRVVALDHYAWSIDFEKASAYTLAQRVAGQPIRAFHTLPEIWDPAALPGKRGFDLAYRLRHSHAEVVVDNFMTMNMASLGTFDVVLLLGVIYHLEEPLRALQRLRQLTRGVAVIESEAVSLPVADGRPLWQFVGGARLNHDPTIFWVPTAEGLLATCVAAGFASAEIVSGPPQAASEAAIHYRAVVHAFSG